jgi:fatty-acyl-CoA synthase
VYWVALRSGLHVTGVDNHLPRGKAAYVVNDCGARPIVVVPVNGELAAASSKHTPTTGSAWPSAGRAAAV